MHKLLLQISYHVSQWVGRINLPFINKSVTIDDFYEAITHAKSGDAILSIGYGQLSNVFIPGKWSHVGMIVAGPRPYVIEATSKGVVRTDLIQFMLSKDECMIMRSDFTKPHQAKRAAEYAKSFIGKPYDYMFQAGSDAFYCAELIFTCYKEVTGGHMPFEMRERLGSMTVTPQDIRNAKGKWSPVWSSNSLKGKDV